MKRLLALLLAMLTCASAFAACSENAQEPNGDFSVPDGDNSQEDPSMPEENKEPMPEYWGYNDYENFENPNAPEEIKSFPTKVTKVNDKKYQFQCETEVGRMTVTLEQRPWGMFNLWAWNLIDTNGKLRTFLVGATDLEYVFRTVLPTGKTIFSGGNHGGEALISMDIYNGETGERLDLANGQSVEVNSLHVIEKSKLLLISDDNGDSICDYDGVNVKEYTEDQVYANVTRKYTFTGPQVKLNTDFEYVKDTKHYYSYYTMFPISKKYGQWCDMIDREGNLIKTIETTKVGKADYSGPQYSGNAATRVVLYGYEDPRYQFDVRINTPTDSLGNSQNDYKTSIWDMNTSDNKVYFSKFPTNTTETVEAGTQFHTETIWLFKYVADATLPEGSEVSKPFEEIEPKGTLASQGKPYEISGNGIGYGVYTANLTDGKWVDGLTYDGQWFGFCAGNENNTVSNVGTVILDLESVQDLSSLRVHICNGGEAGIAAPSEIRYLISDDGESFTKGGTLPVNEVTNATYWTTVTDLELSARYVKFEFPLNGSFVFINEIEAYTK